MNIHGEVTHRQIARELGITHQRVQQIEREALRKCRTWCVAHGYRLEDLLPVGGGRYRCAGARMMEEAP